jgi:antitoxin ParD1/3/4
LHGHRPIAEKLSITLPEKMVAIIKKKVASGAFASTSKVIREAMRIWQKREDEHAERFASIRARVERSLADPRPDVPVDEVLALVFERHERKLDEQ